MRLTDWLALRCRQRVCFEEAMYVQKHARVETKEDCQWLTRTNTTARQQGALKAPLLNIFVPYNPKGSITNAEYKAQLVIPSRSLDAATLVHRASISMHSMHAHSGIDKNTY